MHILSLLALSLMPAIVIMAGVRDLTTMTIPNWMSAALVLGFVPAALLNGVAPMTMLISAGIATAFLVAGATLFAFRIIGGGDAKLMAAGALWLGLEAAAPFLLWTAIIGGLFSLGLILSRPRFAVLAPTAPAWMGRLMDPRGDIPYGVAIAAGALIAYPHSALMGG